jgi:hypothetical protein
MKLELSTSSSKQRRARRAAKLRAANASQLADAGDTGIAKPAARSNRGVALIMVLVITTVMSAIAADLSNGSKVNLSAAANARDQLQAYFHARSAVELELFVLRFQGQLKGVLENFVPIPLFEMSGYLISSDTMKGILDRGETPSDERPKERKSDEPFGDFDGSFWIEEVVDENRKVNLNMDSGTACNPMHLLLAAVIDDPKYDVLFEGLGESRDPIRNRLEIIANITDWVDGNENLDPVCAITGDMNPGQTAEDNRYERLPYNVRYEPKNGQMTSLAELRMVPGVNDAFMRLFAKYFTVWSDKKGISMKTADDFMVRAVVRAIMRAPATPADEEKFQKFMEERMLRMALPPPLNKMTQQMFTELLDAAQIAYDPAKLTDLISKEMIRFDDISSVYRITAMGRVHETTSTITVVWRDDRSTGEIWYWREE